MSGTRRPASSSRPSGCPLVLGLLWLGGWWLFVLAVVAGVLALHEFYAMTRRCGRS